MKISTTAVRDLAQEAVQEVVREVAVDPEVEVVPEDHRPERRLEPYYQVSIINCSDNCIIAARYNCSLI